MSDLKKYIPIILVCSLGLPALSYAEVYTANFSKLSAAQEQRINTDATETADTFYRLYEQRDIHANNTTARVRTTLIERFHNASDIQEYGQYSISVNPETQTLHILRAISVAANGSTTSANHEDIKIIDSNSYDIFSSQKEILINIPAIEEGGYAVIEYDITTHKAKLEADWLETFYPQVLTAKKEYVLTASWDDDYSPSLFIESDAVTCTNTTTSVECKGSNITALAKDPQVRWRDEIGYIHISDKSSWQQVVESYSTIFNTALASSDTDLLKEIELDKQASTEEKINQIHQFVAQKIRYLSRSEYGNAYTPHKTTETLVKRQGDCKDKSALLVDLLQRIGVKAYPVLVSTHRKKLRDKIAPSLAQFNHVVVCFDLPASPGDQPHCIDATDIDSPWQHTPSWIQGNFSLPLNATTPSLIHAPVYRWEFAVDTQLKFHKDGGQTETQSRTYHSHYATWYKSYINSTETAEVARWFIEDYQQKVSNQSTPSISFSGQDTMGAPITIKSITQFDPFINADEDLDYSENDNWLAAELEEGLLSNKIYDEYFPGLKLTSTFHIDLNAIWQATLTPANLQLDYKYGSVVRKATMAHDIVKTTTTVDIPGRWVKTDEIETFNKFIKALRKELKLQVYGKVIQP